MKPTAILTAALLCVLSPVCFAVDAAPSPAPQKMPWEDPSYAMDISATQADSRAEERAKGGWTEFIRHHEDRKRWVTEKKVDILMIGDSIVFGWSREGNKVWNEHYGNRNAVNIGSSGDRTSHMLWHIQDGGLDGMKDRNPGAVVIMIGTNNRGEPANEGRDTAQGVLAILKEVHHRLPDSKILLLAIFPRGWKPEDEGRIRNDQINGILKTYADYKTVYWLDLKDTFLDKDGMLRKELMPDALHPNVEGYREWAKAMEPMLAKLLTKGMQSGDRKLAATPPQPKPPLHGLEEVGWQNVDLRGGFWGPRLDIHHKETIPHVIAKLDERKHIANFDVAAKVLKGAAAKQGGTDSDPAGKALEGDAGNHGPGSDDPSAAKEGEIVGHSAFDSDIHKALEGACYTLGHYDDPALSQRVEGILDRILAAQEKDGYLVSYFTAKEPQNKWANLRLNHEMYNAGHFFEFAVAHHQLTGKTNALDAAKRFADHMDRTFGPNKRYDVDGHQEIELALVKLYRATGEKRYLDLCRFFLEERGHVHGTERKRFTEVIPRGNPERKPGETNPEWMKRKWSLRDGKMQDHKPVLEQTEAVGHAVRAGYMYSAMTDLARFSESPEYAKAVRTLWDDVLRSKIYITGGVGTAQYDEEGFGDPYRLPNSTYCESCANMANVLWQHRMNLLDGDAKYADVMELTLYNSAIAGLALSGKGFFYQNPLESRDGAERPEWIGLACCPTSHSRFTPQVGGMVYARKAGKIFVNLYAAGEASIALGEDRVVKISQETDYPWDGRIKLKIAPDQPSEFDLCVRIPGWALGKPVPSDLYRFASTEAAPVSLKINGETVEAKPGKDGYVHLARSWKAGDEVALDLPMPVRRVHAHEKVEADKGKVALMRGPIVYCLEGVDNKGVDVFKLSLPTSSELKTEHRATLLGGVTVIHPQGLDANKTPVTLTAIPWYAWANREKGPMTIWINEGSEVK